MDSITQTDEEPLVQKWALWIALIVYAAFVGFYAWIFKLPISDSVANWGQFGDYVGGAINPIVGLITIWLLTASLKQSREEMILTRKALQDAEVSQKATEAALKEQIVVSEHARDMNNAVALCRSYEEQAGILGDLLQGTDPGFVISFVQERQHAEEACSKLKRVLAVETKRILDIYRVEESV